MNGILCESDGCDYVDQPHYTPLARDPLRVWIETGDTEERKFWVYLDVWERHVTAIEHPSIREVALGGPDTCSRVQVIWQVRSLERADVESKLKRRLNTIGKRLEQGQGQNAVELARLNTQYTRILQGLKLLAEDASGACSVPLLALARDNLPELAAWIDRGQRLDDPCITSPESGYRGAENHLYRVEIHQGNANDEDEDEDATFKWSRDNGSVATRWLGAAGNRLTVANSRGFSAGQWVELSHDEDDLLGRAGPLFRIASVDADQLTVEGTPVWVGDATNPKVRRWDQIAYGDVLLTDGAVPVTESTTEPVWIDLEDGVKIRFAANRKYRSGDYWLIPARVAAGRLEWPEDARGNALLQPPRGIEHHYAPLGFIGRAENGGGIEVVSCACTVYPLNSCGTFRDWIKGEAQTAPAPAKPAAPAPAVGIVAKPADTSTARNPNKKTVVEKPKPDA